jgi:NinB protein
VEWMGKKFNIDIWKRLVTAAWMREQNEQPMMIPALDGNGFDIIFERTSKLTQSQCGSLVEWILAFGAEHNVKWSAPDYDESYFR